MRHAQTLDERGRFWKHGRWWWGRARCEWSWLGSYRSTGVSFSLGGGDDQREAQWHLGLWVVSVYFSVTAPRWLCERLLPYRIHTWEDKRMSVPAGTMHSVKITSEREFSYKIHGGALWWCLWMNPDEWNHTDPKWRRGNFNPADFFFGRYKYSERILETVNVLIPMPEKPYPATIEMREDSWKRPRWPFTRYMKRANIDVPNGIPHQGKGENSWDCGPDATYGMTCPARTIAQAVGTMVESCYRDRLRYGIVEPAHSVKAESESAG